MTLVPSNEQIRIQLEPYASDLSDTQCEAIRLYIDLLLRWRERVSLTTVTKISEILRFHIGESIYAITIGLVNKGRLADVGSGAGFPGIPLALFSSQLDVTLIEANAKKATFLAEAQRVLGLNNVKVLRQRYEVVASKLEFRFASARALGQYESFLKWSKKSLEPSGRAVLWLGADDAKQIGKISGWQWESPILIPDSANRVILAGRVTAI